MAYDKSKKKEIKERIIFLVSEGVSLNRALKEEQGMPSRPTVFEWLNPTHKSYDKSFSYNYTQARSLRADHIFEEILEIADKQGSDVIIVDGKEVTNHNVINRNRLQVDARKWILAKMQPKKYGDKLDLTSGDKPIKSEKTTIVFKDKKK